MEYENLMKKIGILISGPNRIFLKEIHPLKTQLIRLACLLVLAVSGEGLTAERREKPHAEADPMVAFINVHVVPMDTERLIANQTVIVGQGTIVRIGPAETTPIPSDAVRVDGTEKYLMPGLVDMHVHVRHPNALPLYIANGVTTVRNMSGSPRHLLWRRNIAQGKLLGPTLYTAGPIVNGKHPSRRWGKRTFALVETAAQAEQVVAQQKKAGYDFIKVYDHLTPEAYRGIMVAAQKYAMPVVGHVPRAVGLPGVLAAGQASIEHLYGFVEMIQRDNAPLRSMTGWRDQIQAFNRIDASKITAVATAMRQAGVWNCVTLVAMQRLVPGKQAQRWLEREEMKFISPKQLALWKSLRFRDNQPMNLQLVKQASGIRTKMTQALHEAGAKILLGTDAMAPFVVPGFSIHDELHNLVEAGLTPYEAIRAGTRDAAEFLAGLDRFGTLAMGQRADLILLEANPLDDVANVAKRAGVMVRGRWLPQVELAGLLEKRVSQYNKGEKRSGKP